MRPANRLGMYEDVRVVLDAALTASGGIYRLETHGAAVHWRHRAYKFRKLYAETYAPAPSPYDRLTLPKIGPESTEVVIKILGESTRGTFVPANEPTAIGLEPEVQNFVESLIRKIDIGED